MDKKKAEKYLIDNAVKVMSDRELQEVQAMALASIDKQIQLGVRALILLTFIVAYVAGEYLF